MPGKPRRKLRKRMTEKKDYWNKRRKMKEEVDELVSGMVEDWWQALVLEEARGCKRRRGRSNGRRI
jgi:hypothetical protein